MNKKRVISIILLIILILTPILYSTYQTQNSVSNNLTPISDNKTPSGNFTLPTEDDDDTGTDGITIHDQDDDIQIEDQTQIKDPDNTSSDQETGQDSIRIEDDIDPEIKDKTDIDSETHDIQITDDITIEPDTNNQNFTSKEIIIKTDNLDNTDKKRVISQYEDTYLLKFPTENSAKQTYEKYFEQNNEFVAPNINLSIQNNDDTQQETYIKIQADEPALDSLETNLNDNPNQISIHADSKENMIALIDTGVSTTSQNVIERVSMLGDNGIDNNGHGTDMLNAILDNDPNAQIISIKALDDNGYGNVASIYSAIKYAIEKQVDIINLSIAGYSVAENQAITTIIQEAIDAGIHVIGAAGNYSSDVKDFVPGNIKDILTIGACNNKGAKLKLSNYGETIDFNVVAESTSTATAIFTGRFSRAQNDITEINKQLNQNWIFEPNYNPNDADIKIENDDDITVNEPENKKEHTTNPIFKIQANLKKTGIYSATGFDYVLCQNGFDLSDAEITGDGWSVKKARYQNKASNKIYDYLAYETIYSSPGGTRHICQYSNRDEGRLVNLPNVTVRFPEAAEDVNDYYDVVIKFKDITGFIPNGADNKQFTIFNTRPDGSGWFSANFMSQENICGIVFNAYITLYEVGSDTKAPEGPLFLAFEDLDQPSHHIVVANEDDGIIRKYGDLYAEFQESIRVYNPIGGVVYTERTPYLNIPDVTTSDQNWFADFLSKGSTGPNDTHTQKSSGISYLTSSRNGMVCWQGSGCYTQLGQNELVTYIIWASKNGPGTITYEGDKIYKHGTKQTYTAKAKEGAELVSLTVDGEEQTITDAQKTQKNYTFNPIVDDHDIEAVFEWKKFKQITYVRHQKADGTWTEYTKINGKNVKQGDEYWYTWTRNTEIEPENVYKNGTPAKVGTDNVTEDKDYKISVYRKQYTYSFDFNPPEGHDESEITNKQSDFTKYAENSSGNVASPALTGFSFGGWNTKADGTGTAYKNEKMLSNKTFYAIWDPISYYIRYNDNGSSEPDKLEGEFTQNTVTTNSGMPNTKFDYDTAGSLRPNDFIRSGYDFIGWNTQPDGSGIAFDNSPYDLTNMYSDGSGQIYNATTEPNAVLDLYAQWKKKLGSETLTVISEETGNPVPNTYFRLYKQVNGSWQGVPGMEVLRTDSNGKITVNDLHWFNYEWRATEVPIGYQTPNNLNFMITHDRLRSNDTIILYMIRTTITLRSEVSDIIRGENPPAFMYHISGYDVAGMQHEYNILVNTSIATYSGEKTLVNIFAGRYDVTQTPISRYNPQNARNIVNGSVNGINAHVTPLTPAGSSATFPYTIDQYGGFGSMTNQDNKINK